MKIRTQLLNELLAATAVGLGRMLYRTLRIKVNEADPKTNPYLNCGYGEAVIYLVWHDSILTPLFAGRHRATVALVSKHRDGSFLAASLRRLRIGLVRGSSSRGGASAMLEMLDLPAGKNIVITPDGPRGPRRQIKLGPLFLASRCGRAIVPTAFVPAKCWRVKGTWTEMQIPKPFTTLYALTGEPIAIAPGLSRDELREVEQRVQAAMDALNAHAKMLADGQVPAGLATGLGRRDQAALKRAG